MYIDIIFIDQVWNVFNIEKKIGGILKIDF